MYFTTTKYEFINGHKPGGTCHHRPSWCRHDWIFGDPEGRHEVTAPGGMSFIEAKKWFSQQYPGYQGEVQVRP
jgi:hypothetical protein